MYINGINVQPKAMQIFWTSSYLPGCNYSNLPERNTFNLNVGEFLYEIISSDVNLHRLKQQRSAAEATGTGGNRSLSRALVDMRLQVCPDLIV